MELQTKDLILRPFTKDDVTDLQREGNTPDIHRYNWYIPYPFTPADARNLILDAIYEEKNESPNQYRFAIERLSTQKLIGASDMYDINYQDKKAKVGYWIGKDHRRNGYASQALDALIDFSFHSLDLIKVSAKVLQENMPSQNLLAKKGFRRVGIQEKEKKLGDGFHDCVLFELLR